MAMGWEATPSHRLPWLRASQYSASFPRQPGEGTEMPIMGEHAELTQDTPHKGMQSENGVVVGMLEAIEAKLCGLESDTKAAEAEEQ